MKTITALLCVLCSTALAQPPDIPPGEDRIEALDPNERAPYQGMLLDIDTALRWTNRLRWYREELRLQVERFDASMLAVRQSCDAELEVVRQSMGREIEGLRGDIREQAQMFERSRRRPFYDTFGFGLVLGVVLVGVVVGLAAWVAN